MRRFDKQADPFYSGRAWRKVRQQALNRDGGMCVECMMCETADENVSEAVKDGWFTAPYAPSVEYAISPVSQPADLALTAGAIGPADVLVFVADGSDGGTPAYQWYRNVSKSATGGTVLTGATAAAYAIPANTAAGTYYYYCVAAYHGKTVTSDVATVTVS